MDHTTSTTQMQRSILHFPVRVGRLHIFWQLGFSPLWLGNCAASHNASSYTLFPYPSTPSRLLLPFVYSFLFRFPRDDRITPCVYAYAGLCLELLLEIQSTPTYPQGVYPNPQVEGSFSPLTWGSPILTLGGISPIIPYCARFIPHIQEQRFEI